MHMSADGLPVGGYVAWPWGLTHLEELVVPRAEDGDSALQLAFDDCLHEEPHHVEEPRLVHDSNAPDAYGRELSY